MEDYQVEIDDSKEEKFVIENGTPRKIKFQTTTPTIQSLYQDWKDGDLVISPSFQRNYVWNNIKASNLIESILLNIPLPIIFTASTEGKEEVIDGQQRLTSIFAFIDGRFPDGTKFKLSKNLKLLGGEIGGYSFAQLGKHYQKTLKKYPLFLVSISEDSQEEVKFEMFERLNTNITSLNAQELRNCLYRGPYNSLLRIMAGDKDFQYIINKPTYQKRMQDVELVLMFCAFHNTSPDHYKKSLSQMLNDEMRNHKTLTDKKRALLEKQFKKSVRLIRHIWGDRAFNIYSIDEKTKKVTWTKTFNQGLFQILTYWFIHYETHHVIQFADIIKEELINLQIHDESFRDTLTGSGTNSPHNLKLKFDIWGNTIKGILNYPKNEPRAFSYSLKEQLWEEDNTCQICSQKISTIDDAEIDHIICYWKGGKTIPENARLTHRFCNRSRGGKDSAHTETSKAIIRKKDFGVNVKKTDEVFTLERMLKDSNSDAAVKKNYLEFRNWLLKIGDDIEETIKKTMGCYYSNSAGKSKGLVWLEPRSNNLLFHLRKGTYSDRQNKIKPNGWGGYPEIKIYSEEFDTNRINYIKDLLMQAYRL